MKTFAGKTEAELIREHWSTSALLRAAVDKNKPYFWGKLMTNHRPDTDLHLYALYMAGKCT
jgi:hypothetical protein